MSNRVTCLGVFALSLITTGIMSSHAQAADLDAPYVGSQQFPEDRAEFGSGWYIRGDLGATRIPSISTTTPATVPTPVYPNPISPGFVSDPPTAVVTSGNHFGYTASLGAGYQVTSWFRTDVIADFHKPIATSFSNGSGKIFCPTAVSYPTDATTGLLLYKPLYASGGCTGNYAGKLSSYDVMLNGYIDIGSWHGITPYVGGGVGLAFGHYQTSSRFVMSNNVAYAPTYTDQYFNTSVYQNFDRSSSGTYYNFAWALMGGAAIDVYDHTKLDIGYRYLNLGKINGVSNVLASQEVHAGVRYMIDN